jgi:AAA+ ATPase superfamily predicted ATPase
MKHNFPATDRFVNRVRELEAMQDWWTDDTQKNALNLYGRRRVGKSWLFRQFAHQKEATVLVAERLAPGAQINRLALQLESSLGVVPQIQDVPDLFRLLYKLGQSQRHLVVLDEFPYLLPRGEAAREEILTAIQAVMEEERENSHSKLILCGSYIEQMKALMEEGSALMGRLIPLRINPMTFEDALLIIQDKDPIKQIERYAVAGGMARYLAELGSGESLKNAICERILNPNGPLFNDPREVLGQELQQVHNYFSILQELSTGEKSSTDIANALETEPTALSRQLENLQHMQLVERITPVNAIIGGKKSRYRVSDPFLRFWFRFVFPYQEDLASGLLPPDLYDLEIAPQLATHVSPIFENLCRVWVRKNRGATVSRVSNWWGASTYKGRQDDRYAEEIDIVGKGKNKVTVIGECKWTKKSLSVSILASLENYKIPALRQDKVKVEDSPEIILFCKAGFTDGLKAAAQNDQNITLVEMQEVVDGCLL